MSEAVLGAVLLLALLGAAFVAWWSRPRSSSAGEGPLPRRCPACGSTLADGETILAERLGPGTGRDGRERILIKGCPHCLGPGKIR